MVECCVSFVACSIVVVGNCSPASCMSFLVSSSCCALGKDSSRNSLMNQKTATKNK